MDMETTNIVDVGIVVVTYNRIGLLQEVIESLRSQTFTNNKIVIVNNGSTDGTTGWLAKQEDLIVINQENVGGSGGFFSGIKYVAEHHFKYCWIMDDDVICRPTALEELVKAVEVNINAGFVCSRVVGVDGVSAMNTPCPDARPSVNGYSDIFDLVTSHAMVKVSLATFVSVLFSIDTVYELGLPMKDYFIWGDDTEYTERISAIKPCYIACKSVVMHKRNMQSVLSFENEVDPKRMRNFYYFFRNQLCTARMHHGKRSYLRLIKSDLLLVVRFLIKGDASKAKIILKALVNSTKFHPTIEYPQRTKLGARNCSSRPTDSKA